MKRIAADVLPEGMRYEWTGIIYQQLQAANLAPVIFGLAFVFVYLFLDAQYESWVMPLVVMLSVPLAMFGGIGAQWLLSHTNEVYCQIGMVMLIGLCSKNSILIVEFAQNLRDQGKPIIETSHLRLRPILMTAFPFILGVLPPATASGAGPAARRSLGTTVLGEMLVFALLSLVSTRNQSRNTACCSDWNRLMSSGVCTIRPPGLPFARHAAFAFSRHAATSLASAKRSRTGA